MCIWACSYLEKILGIHRHPPPSQPYENCQLLLSNVPRDKIEILTIKMRDAWRQKTYREKQKKKGNKPCSFVLSSHALKKLQQLANETKKPLRETLEEVILGTYLQNKNQKKVTKPLLTSGLLTPLP